METRLIGGLYVPVEQIQEVDPGEYEDEYEDQQELPENATEHLCEACNDPICLEEDSAVVHVVVPSFQDDHIVYTPMLMHDGEPLARPLLFHFPCFENVGQEVSEIIADEPAIQEPHAALDCDYCQSTIRMGELLATVQLGEVIVSPRLAGTTTFQFAVNSDGSTAPPFTMCLSCVARMSEAIGVEDWEDITQKGECYLCMKGRCWRVGRCICTCHLEA